MNKESVQPSRNKGKIKKLLVDGKNLDEKKIQDKNLRAIERIDPFVNEILTQSSHSAIFEFDVKKMEWAKSDVDGTLFIYSRIDLPFYSFMVANRQSLNDFIYPITPTLRLKYMPPHIFMYNPDGMIKSLWVYGEDECKRIFKVISTLRGKSWENSTIKQ